MLQRRGRVAYRTLKLQFNLDDDHLEALKEPTFPFYDLWAGSSTAMAALGSIRTSQGFCSPTPERRSC